MKIQPHQLFWLAVPIFLSITANYHSASADFQLYDTYYIVAFWKIGITISAIFALFGIFYWSLLHFGLKLKKALGFLHFVLTFSLTVILLLVSSMLTSLGEIPNIEDRISDFRHLQILAAILVLLLIVAQVLFLANLAIGLFRRNRS